jgi:protein-L-isoaspartate O-methyltransferase
MPVQTETTTKPKRTYNKKATAPVTATTEPAAVKKPRKTKAATTATTTSAAVETPTLEHMEATAKPKRVYRRKDAAAAAEAAAATANNEGESTTEPVNDSETTESETKTKPCSNSTNIIREQILMIMAEKEKRERLLRERDAELYRQATARGKNQNTLVDELLVNFKNETGTDLDPRVEKVLRKYDRFHFMKVGDPELYEYDGKIIIEQKYGLTMGTIYQHAKSLQEMMRILPPIDATEEQLEKFEHKYISVLDLGCGTGYLTACMADLIGLSWKHRLFAMDLNNNMSSAALENVTAFPEFRRAYKKDIIKFVYGDAMLGYDYGASYNFITYGFKCDGIPVCVAEQLAMGGYIIAPVKNEYMLVHKTIKPNTAEDATSPYKIVLDTNKVGAVPDNMESGATEEQVDALIPYSSFQRPVDEEYYLTDYEIAMISQEASVRAKKFKKEEEQREIDRKFEEDGYKKTTLEEIQALAGVNLEEIVLQSLASAGLTMEKLYGAGYKLDLSNPRIKTETSKGVDDKGMPVTNTTNSICFGNAKPTPANPNGPAPITITNKSSSTSTTTTPHKLSPEAAARAAERSARRAAKLAAARAAEEAAAAAAAAAAKDKKKRGSKK